MVDWQEIHRRLADTRARLDRGWSLDPQQSRRVLKERARCLAREPVSAPLPGERIEFLEFTLAEERYGIEVTHVREVAPVTTLIPVPCTPGFVAGLISLRGQILSVIDVGKYLGIAGPGRADLDRVIVLGTETMLVGVLATAIIGLNAVARHELETLLPTLTGRREEYLKGVTRQRVAIVDAQKFLSDPAIIVHAEVEA